MDELVIALAWLAFGGTHTVLAMVGIRDFFIRILGKNGFKGVYSLIGLASFGFLIYSFYRRHGSGTAFADSGADHLVFLVLNHLLMFLAFALFFGGFFNKTPMSMIPAIPKAVGVIRITRHPMNMAFALFGLAHLLTNRLTTDWVFYGGFLVYGFIGSLHQDRKKLHQTKDALDDFIAETSVTPFAAIFAGKQRLRLGEISKFGLLLALIATIAARILHPSILEMIRG